MCENSIVDQMSAPFVRWITYKDSLKNSKTSGNEIKMNKTKGSQIISGILENDKELMRPICDMTFDTSELDELDFQKFVDDLSMPAEVDDDFFADGLKTGTLRNRIRYEKCGNTERIIVDNMPNLESDEITKLVKVKIIIPKKNKPVIINTDTYTKFPIMGQQALEQRSTINRTYKKGDSATIVKELVTSRFREVLINCYEKTRHRQTSKIQTLKTQQEEIDELPQQEEIKEFPQEEFSELPQEEIKELPQEQAKNTSLTSESYEYESVPSFNDNDNENSAENEETLEDISKSVSDAQIIELPNREKSVEAVEEYDERKFLEEALGHEFANLTNSIMNYNNSVHSIGTSNISTLISTNATYQQDTYTEDSNIVPEPNQRLLKLLIESKIQNQIIAQTSKALNFCKNTKEFNYSSEHMEAERILLHTVCKYNAIRDEIRRLEYEEIDRSDKYLGTINISQMVFSTETLNASHPANKKRKRDYKEWFVCVLTSGPKVIITKNVQADYDGLIRFIDEIRFEKLSLNFEINIAIYTIRIRNNLKGISHESKYHLDKEPPTMCPLSPPRMFSGGKVNRRPLKTPFLGQYCNEPSAYDFSGHCVLHKDNLNNLGHYTLTGLTSGTLQRNFVVDFASSVDICDRYDGFLDVGMQTSEGVLWNRRWCVLSGHLLSFSNYPEQTKAIACIDLKDTASAQIAKAGRHRCARPRTLLLESFAANKEHYVSRKVHKYFLAADTLELMNNWEYKLNATLDALKTWNVMNYSRN